MNTQSRNGIKVFTLSLVILSLSGCFDSDDYKIEVVNVPPTASDADFITQTETDIVERLPASDINQDPLTFAITTDPSLGTVSVSANGTFTYTPKSERTGMDSFTYSVTDGISPAVSGTINITIEALQVSFSEFSRDAFNQAPTDTPLSVNGREFSQDVVNQSDYQDLIDGN
ncbi:Ig-like domain-containing protein [Glaciecola sp. KUL10]|uniref:Ig-like domain-containing protein n=1 Tax=Glaciecola sp. (strain KUL10) TaxID=2161813 RepID=UPI000D78C514|nr:Ig-like domain-containing protein [Glaciecola sp. KUL10]GBL04962.1 hemagglutinin/hemolysin-like protein [Glaciecola sp. KUL10]